MYSKNNVIKTDVKLITINIKNDPYFQLALEAFEEICKETKENLVSNVHASIVSEYNSHNKNYKLMILSNYLAKLASLRICRNSELENSYYLRIANCWAAHYLKDDWTNEHDHMPCRYSAVLYLKLGKEDNKIRFNNHLHHVDEGDFLLFPAFVKHSVDRTIEERKVIAFNFL